MQHENNMMSVCGKMVDGSTASLGASGIRYRAARVFRDGRAPPLLTYQCTQDRNTTSQAGPPTKPPLGC